MIPNPIYNVTRRTVLFGPLGRWDDCGDLNEGKGWYAMKIFKYPLEVRTNVVTVPFGAQILSVGQQAGELCMWLLVEPVPRTMQIEITVVGTGWDISGTMTDRIDSFIGTVQVGEFVWHAFNTTEPGKC